MANAKWPLRSHYLDFNSEEDDQDGGRNKPAAEKVASEYHLHGLTN